MTLSNPSHHTGRDDYNFCCLSKQLINARGWHCEYCNFISNHYRS